MSIGILYEHPEWFIPLFRALDRRGLPYERVDAAHLSWNPALTPRFSLLFNRMSPSAYLRGHAHAIRATSAFLDYVSARGVPIVNGPAAYALEISKSRQLDLLDRLHVRHPASRVINHAGRALAAADGLRFPLVVKPNIGGSGARIQRFDSPGALEQAVAGGSLDLGIDDVALVQELLPARGGSITRVEILDKRILYAIRLTPPAGHGFNLCPADVCRTPTDTVDSFCAASKPAMDIERVEVPEHVADQALAIARAADLDICGIEYLVDDRDGEVYFYDINALSNFVTDAPAIVGFDPFEQLVDYLTIRHAAVEAAVPVGAWSLVP
jgi:glutathione synthase/RimK-type ligase-like ATP-grasp enzyme